VGGKENNVGAANGNGRKKEKREAMEWERH
jgi:hypothetical protein